jgi:glucokinase
MRERERVERVSVERVVSGLGFPRIYEFLAERSPQVLFGIAILSRSPLFFSVLQTVLTL